MKLSFLLALLFSFLSFFQNQSDWENLKNAAHQLGFCVYRIDETYCKEHIGEYEKRQARGKEEEGEVHYFELKENWAKKRIQKFSSFHERSAKDFLMLFDVQQGPLPDSPDSYSYHGFIIIDLKNEINFIQIREDAKTAKCFIQSPNEYTMMENTLWREFMSGRLGIFSKKIHFFTNNTDTKYYGRFKTAFKKYQQSLN